LILGDPLHYSRALAGIISFEPRISTFQRQKRGAFIHLQVRFLVWAKTIERSGLQPMSGGQIKRTFEHAELTLSVIKSKLLILVLGLTVVVSKNRSEATGSLTPIQRQYFPTSPRLSEVLGLLRADHGLKPSKVDLGMDQALFRYNNLDSVV
jgi:hypothetical protein